MSEPQWHDAAHQIVELPAELAAMVRDAEQGKHGQACVIENIAGDFGSFHRISVCWKQHSVGPKMTPEEKRIADLLPSSSRRKHRP
jgi:hypothetical protein